MRVDSPQPSGRLYCPPVATDWEAEGLLEGLAGSERQARIDLLDLLEAEGCALEDIKRSHAEGELLFLLSGKAIGLQVQYTWDEMVERSGLDERVAELVEDHLREAVVGVERGGVADRERAAAVGGGVGVWRANDSQPDATGSTDPHLCKWIDVARGDLA